MRCPEGEGCQGSARTMKGEVRPDHQQEIGESLWEKTPDTLDQVHTCVHNSAANKGTSVIFSILIIEYYYSLVWCSRCLQPRTTFTIDPCSRIRFRVASMSYLGRLWPIVSGSAKVLSLTRITVETHTQSCPWQPRLPHRRH